MKDRLIYVELKSGHSDNGPAWIGIAGASKTGATVYSNGKAFKSLKGSGIGANFFDIETGDEYWISGIKKNNQDRHWAGGGEVAINRLAVDAYLAETSFQSLPSNLVPTDLLPAKQQSHQSELEHNTLEPSSERYDGGVPDSRAAAIKRKS
ncbi:MAG: hypothetical protein AAF216_14505 [Pseudomonadota bacterium]